jgi:hypothetical protein
MVAHLDFTSRRAMCTSIARDLHVPRSFLVCALSLWIAPARKISLSGTTDLLGLG